MRSVEVILRGIEGNIEEFKRLCEAKVCSADLRKDIDKALSQGSVLSADIDKIIKHLMLLKGKLDREES
jgi:hypothetical protein